MKCWWLSWWAANTRPVTWPLPDAWLGTWCSGERDAEPSWSMCAWVEAATESEAWALVAAGWPELDRFAHVRFCKESDGAPGDGAPGDRFPRPRWATGAARDAAWGAE